MNEKLILSMAAKLQARDQYEDRLEESGSSEELVEAEREYVKNVNALTRATLLEYVEQWFDATAPTWSVEEGEPMGTLTLTMVQDGGFFRIDADRTSKVSL
jgi:hypothetical protein